MFIVEWFRYLKIIFLIPKILLYKTELILLLAKFFIKIDNILKFKKTIFQE